MKAKYTYLCLKRVWMRRIAFWLIYPILKLLSILPDKIFYGISDFAFLVIYYFVGYRKKVVDYNLTLAFPEKDKEWRNKIKKKFYHHFCDSFLEMTKTFSISEEELKKRFVLKNPEELERLQKLNKSNVWMMAHYSSYEWVIALVLQGLYYKTYGIYKRIRNPYFEKLIKDSRGKFDTQMIAKNDVARVMIKNKKKGILATYGMVADQSPKTSSAQYWRPFMGHVVPVFMGSERLARKLDFAVTYLKIESVKRGYYEVEFVSIADEPRKMKEYYITDKYIELLEEQIRSNPEYYLWTHKRWKHEGKKQSFKNNES